MLYQHAEGDTEVNELEGIDWIAGTVEDAETLFNSCMCHLEALETHVTAGMQIELESEALAFAEMPHQERLASGRTEPFELMFEMDKLRQRRTELAQMYLDAGLDDWVLDRRATLLLPDVASRTRLINHLKDDAELSICTDARPAGMYHDHFALTLRYAHGREGDLCLAEFPIRVIEVEAIAPLIPNYKDQQDRIARRT